MDDFAIIDPCIRCMTVVRPNQEAIGCDCCVFWQHRKCQMGI